MRAADLITQSVPQLKLSDTASTVLQLMSDNHLTQLPLVDGKKLLGLLREDDILNYPLDEKIGSMKLALIRPFIHDYEHIFEVLKVASELKMRVVPVIDKNEIYLGCITLESLLNYFAKETDILEAGGILVLEIEVKDYSLAEVSRLVEEESGRVLCAFAGSIPDTIKMELTLKINKPDLQAITASLQRHNYIIKDTYQEPEYFDDLKNRFDSLMNYLNV
jgi:predicted transcriptional regulator